MKPLRIGLLFGLVLTLALFAGNRSSSSNNTSLTQNLDLPYDAIGLDDGEENAPEVVSLYGGIYEADSVVFCLDESKSMDWNNRWSIQQREITRAIMELSPRAYFGLVFYGGGAHAFRDTLVPASPANKGAAISFLTGRQLSFGTCLGTGVVKSLKLLQQTNRKYRTVIVAGDGRPTRCPFTRGNGLDISDAELNAILQSTVTANTSRSRVHTIFVGERNDHDGIDFMKKLATAHGGTFRSLTR